VVGPGLKLEVLTSTGGTEFSSDTEMYRVMAKATQAMDPAGLIFPMLMMGATDACQYQHAGIAMYGFTPGLLPKDFPLASLGHGHDERLPLSYIESGLPVLWQVVQEICS
jgi:acetylornithine deacetylase/succinyl-diaminopimelate desuccinylase-like protein